MWWSTDRSAIRAKRSKAISRRSSPLKTAKSTVSRRADARELRPREIEEPLRAVGDEIALEPPGVDEAAGEIAGAAADLETKPGQAGRDGGEHPGQELAGIEARRRVAVVALLGRLVGPVRRQPVVGAPARRRPQPAAVVVEIRHRFSFGRSACRLDNTALCSNIPADFGGPCN